VCDADKVFYLCCRTEPVERLSHTRLTVLLGNTSMTTGADTGINADTGIQESMQIQEST
jgi:hypothetical protein